MTYGFKMAGDITDTRSLGMMKEVEEDLNRTIRVILVLIQVIYIGCLISDVNNVGCIKPKSGFKHVQYAQI